MGGGVSELNFGKSFLCVLFCFSSLSRTLGLPCNPPFFTPFRFPVNVGFMPPLQTHRAGVRPVRPAALDSIAFLPQAPLSVRRRSKGLPARTASHLVSLSHIVFQTMPLPFFPQAHLAVSGFLPSIMMFSPAIC